MSALVAFLAFMFINSAVVIVSVCGMKKEMRRINSLLSNSND